MKPQETIYIAVADTSMIIRSGLVSVLRRLPDLPVQVIEVSSEEGLKHCMEAHTPQILIINPQFGGWFDVAAFKQEYPEAAMKFVSLIYTMVDANQLKGYDDSVNLFDDVDSLSHKVSMLMNVPDEEESDQDSLSQREKEIVGCVVRGMTNKEIAEKLFLGEGTVRNYLSTILEKLNLRDRTQLAVFYYQNR